MRSKQQPQSAKLQLPMTPMIDCTFNLLIFFLLTPAFAMTEGFLTTDLPNVGPNAGLVPPVPLGVKVELYEEGDRGQDVSIVVNNKSLGANFEALRAELLDLRARGLDPRTAVVIAPTMATRHRWVVRAFDEAVAAQFADIQFAVPYQ